MNDPKYRLDLDAEELGTVETALSSYINDIKSRMHNGPDHPFYMLRAEALGRARTVKERIVKKRRQR